MAALRSVAVVLWLCGLVHVQACTDFRLNTSNGVVSARTMDYDADLQTVVEVIPRGTVVNDIAVLGCADCGAANWTTSIGYVALNMYGINLAADGMNEHGLSAAWLNLYSSQYPSAATLRRASRDRPVIAAACSFILGNFANVEQVKLGLDKVVIGEMDGAFQTPLLHIQGLGASPLQIAVHDASGASLVIEFLEGSMRLFDRDADVLTNDPALPKQLEMLAQNTKRSQPGGYTSIDRFQRISILNQRLQTQRHTTLSDVDSEKSTISDAIQLLRTVVRPTAADPSQWSVVRDHQRRRLYFQSYQNQALRRVDLARLNFADQTSRRCIPLHAGPWHSEIPSALTRQTAMYATSVATDANDQAVATLTPVFVAGVITGTTLGFILLHTLSTLSRSYGTKTRPEIMTVRSACALALALLPHAFACSDFLLNSKTNSVVSARSMDFKVDLKTVAEVIPRGTKFQELPALQCPDCPDYEWEAKLGFVAMNVWGLNVATDGMNEAGLSAAWLYLVGTEYPVPEDDEDDNSDDSASANATDASLPVVTSVCTYILGNYATVDQVREGLKTIQIAEFDERIQIPLLRYDTGLHRIPLHVSIHDAAGKSLVIEFLHGKTRVTENDNGVLTNEPPLKKQLKALEKNGWHDIPGGYGSISRFVRLSVINHQASEPYSAAPPGASYLEGNEEQQSISHALHILNAVVLPPLKSATEWTIVRDHGRRKLYFQSTLNQILRVIDFSQIDFSDASVRHALPVTIGNWFLDITPTLLSKENQLKTMDLPPRSKVEQLLKKFLEEEGKGGGFAIPTMSLNAQPEEIAAPSSSGHLGTFLAGGAFGVLVAVVSSMARKHRKRRMSHRFPYQRILDPEEVKYRSM
ncbi:TPA: hypothetical protein N0F65_009466 [Lagenidium giganteum]|uniref:Choloylglycine hydrolase/NAAA C-terminal domain-containing protein n=1 Tax=Lagenidium giganteum TaxID=4803 RepID=A0AAV2ZD65_9STRA|nr:TPA: hypothetical protein N0F65_009466 [Lagenidium giganteum]